MRSDMSLALRQQAVLGEGLQWYQGCWWWTDIESATLNVWRPGTPGAQRCRLPDRLGSFAHTVSGRVLLGLSRRLALATLDEDLRLRQLRELVPVDADEPRTRINDGRTDRRGHFVFGTMDEGSDKRPLGGFYQYSMRHGLRRLALPAVAIANSICFSLDGRTMYCCDTLTQTILQCDYDADAAEVANIRPFVRMDRSDAWPDGSVIDSQGCLWNAQWGAGRVVRYSPAGEPIAVVSAPAAHATCPALGGAGRNELMLATAQLALTPQALAEQPDSGSLFGLTLARSLAVTEALFDDAPPRQPGAA